MYWHRPKASPNPSRGVHVAEKAHGRSRSNHLKYQKWLVDLSWLTLEGGANKSRFMSTACLQPSRNLMLFRYCLSSIERSTGLRKIGMKKTSPMRLLEWTGMDAEISDIWNFRRRAKINLIQQQQNLEARTMTVSNYHTITVQAKAWLCASDWYRSFVS
jgi:hypothetical protein